MKNNKLESGGHWGIFRLFGIVGKEENLPLWKVRCRCGKELSLRSDKVRKVKFCGKDCGLKALS